MAGLASACQPSGTYLEALASSPEGFTHDTLARCARLAYRIVYRVPCTTGRCVVASRDVTAGECVFADEPFAQTVHDRWQLAVCHVCYALLAQSPEAVRGCAECGQVVYCSKACEARGATDHEAECGVLAAVRAGGDSQLLGGVRGLRLFIRLVHRAAAEPEAFAARVERLSEQYEEAPVERQQFLEKMADQINRFVPPGKRMERRRLARLVSRVHVNLYAVSDCAGLHYGSGLYPEAGALVNHSCAPTCAVSFRGRTWRLHALRDIGRGEEVRCS